MYSAVLTWPGTPQKSGTVLNPRPGARECYLRVSLLRALSFVLVAHTNTCSPCSLAAPLHEPGPVIHRP